MSKTEYYQFMRIQFWHHVLLKHDLLTRDDFISQFIEVGSLRLFKATDRKPLVRGRFTAVE